MAEVGRQRTGGVAKKPSKPRRQAYDAAFKLKVVREALQRPASSRIKPTCRDYPDIEPVRAPRGRGRHVRAVMRPGTLARPPGPPPRRRSRPGRLPPARCIPAPPPPPPLTPLRQVQLRKWIRNLAALELAAPTAKCLAGCSRVHSPLHDEYALAPGSPPTEALSSAPSTPTAGYGSPGRPTGCTGADGTSFDAPAPIGRALSCPSAYEQPQPRWREEGAHVAREGLPLAAVDGVDDAALVLLGLSAGASP